MEIKLETINNNDSKIFYLMDEFTPLINELRIKHDNLVIGGSIALYLHGLELGREIDDIDVIVYNPTKEQIDKLNLLWKMSVTKYYGENKRVIKLVGRNKLVLNIIIEKKQKPSFLLMYKEFQVQSIKEVIKAKISYMYDMEKFARLKDFKDLISLKNLNFNYEETRK